jgi:hypothetical protein
VCLLFATAFVVAACSAGSTGKKSATAPVGHNMAGPAQKVIISRQALENRPKPWVLTTPESAVRSYLSWTSYAYRIAQSEVATPTMSAKQEVRVDSYLQLNLEKSKIIDQTLDSITLGKPSVGSTGTLVPANEHWTYRYVSVNKVDQTVGGPYKAVYDTTYTVVKNKKGDWVVDSVKVTALGTVK